MLPFQLPNSNSDEGGCELPAICMSQRITLGARLWRSTGTNRIRPVRQVHLHRANPFTHPVGSPRRERAAFVYRSSLWRGPFQV